MTAKTKTDFYQEEMNAWAFFFSQSEKGIACTTPYRDEDVSTAWAVTYET